jgi:hypothetical protein
MKILLFGELSGLHSNLKEGFAQLGHDVKLWSEGDGYKKMKGDLNYGNSFKNKHLKNFFRFIELWLLLLKIRNYDVVQLISLEMLIMPSFMKIWYLKILKARNGQIVLNRCGLDAYGSCVILGKLDYSPVLNELKEANYKAFCRRINLHNLYYSEKLANFFTDIIVNTYEYCLPYKNFKNYYGSAPLPMLINPNYSPNVVSGKIKILYGILRKDRKGHRFINGALDLIKERYSNTVEIIYVEKVSFQEYEKMLESCNILIDQACSFSMGMNALYALSKGKVVLGGNEKEAEDFYGMSIPIINIKPSVDDIYKKIEELINNPHQITHLGELSNKYTIENHKAEKVAKNYEEIYLKNAKGK